MVHLLGGHFSPCVDRLLRAGSVYRRSAAGVQGVPSRIVTRRRSPDLLWNFVYEASWLTASGACRVPVVVDVLDECDWEGDATTLVYLLSRVKKATSIRL